jgi:hypothetical protein
MVTVKLQIQVGAFFSLGKSMLPSTDTLTLKDPRALSPEAG